MARRCVDLLVASVALVLAAPLLIGIAVLIRMKDGRPILFCQSRAGWRGAPFRMIKFRSMGLDAERTGGSLTFRNDPRITPLGRFLRRSKLDEFPQLFNVLRGDMTLIGPRPEVLDWAEHYTPAQREVFDFKPGLSDPVQLLFRHEHEFLCSSAEYPKALDNQGPKANRLSALPHCPLRCSRDVADVACTVSFEAVRRGIGRL